MKSHNAKFLHQCHCKVACHFKTILWVYIYQLEDVHLGRLQQQPCILSLQCYHQADCHFKQLHNITFLTQGPLFWETSTATLLSFSIPLRVMVRWPVPLRLSPQFNTTDSLNSVLWDIFSDCVDSPSVNIKWYAISSLSPNFNSNDLKSSVLEDLNSDCAISYPELPLSDLPLQDHLLSSPLMTKRSLFWPKCNYIYLGTVLRYLNSKCVAFLPPVSLPSGLPFQDHLSSVTILFWRSLSWEISKTMLHSIPPVSPQSWLPFKDHLLSINLLTQRAQCPNTFSQISWKPYFSLWKTQNERPPYHPW